jgi:hypothetical protein
MQTKSLSFVAKSLLSSSENTMAPTIEATMEAEMTEPTPATETATATIQLDAGNMMEHIYGKTALTIGAIKIAAMPMQEIRIKPPTLLLIHKVPTQGRELEEKSRVQKTSELPTILQWSALTMTVKPMTSLHAVAMHHVEN